MTVNTERPAAFFVTASKERLKNSDVTFSASYELSQPMGKTAFSSYAKTRTNTVS